MPYHDRTHVGKAIAEVQDERTLFVDAPSGASDVIPVTGIKEEDTLLSVLYTADGGLLAPVDYAADCTIVEPRAGAILDADGENAEADDTVTVGKHVFVFADSAFIDNYPAGSNRSTISHVVVVGASEVLSMTNLVAAINAAFAKDPVGVTAELVDTNNVQITAKVVGSAGEGIAVAESGWVGGSGGWFDLEAVPGATTETALLSTAEAGITCSEDLTGAQSTGGIQVTWRVHNNEEPQDVDAKIAGTYNDGDSGYVGLGRMPPGWVPD